MEKHSRVSISLSIIIIVILVIIIVIAYLTKDQELNNNKIISNVMIQLKIISYVFSSIGAMSLVIGILKYQQSKRNTSQRKVEKTLKLLKYFLEKTNGSIIETHELIDNAYQESISKLKKQFFEKFHKPLSINRSIRYMEYTYSISWLLISDHRMGDGLNNIEYWAISINDNSHFINEVELYKELYRLVIPMLGKLINNSKLNMKLNMPACYSLVKRWSKWHNKGVGGALHD